jgi:hypothetical protein
LEPSNLEGALETSRSIKKIASGTKLYAKLIPQ